MGKLIGVSVGSAVKSEDVPGSLIGFFREDRYVLSAGRSDEVFGEEIAVDRSELDRRAVGCSGGRFYLDTRLQRQFHFSAYFSKYEMRLPLLSKLRGVSE